MIPPPTAARKAPLLAAAVTAVAIFLGLAAPVAAQTTVPGESDNVTVPYPVPPGGCRPMDDGEFAPTRGIRPDLETDELIHPQIVKGIRPDVDVESLIDPPTAPVEFGTRPVQLRPVETTVVTGGTSETTLNTTGEVGAGGTAPVNVVKPPQTVRPNVTRGIRPDLKID